MDFGVYQGIIEQFHRAIIEGDIDRLRGLVTEPAMGDLDTVEKPPFPLSDVIELTGVEIEGSGESIAIHYTQRVGDREYPMIAKFRASKTGPRLDHSIPQLRKR